MTVEFRLDPRANPHSCARSSVIQGKDKPSDADMPVLIVSPKVHRLASS